MTKKRIDPKLPIAPTAKSDAWSSLMKPNSFGDRWMRRLNELFLERDGGGVEILDEGVDLGHADSLNFTGSAVTATLSSTTGTINVAFDVSAGVDTMTAVAVEDLAAGQFVAVYNASGTPKCRIAKSSSGQGYQADGFVKAAFATGATATIYLPGSVNVAGGTGLTAGDVWLGTGGYATNTPPTTAGYISQQIGVAESATNVAFEPQPDILLGTPTAGTSSTLQSQTFNASGTFTVPANVTAVWVDIFAGGGSGGGGVTATAGNGGGSGEYCQELLVPVAAGTVAVVVGAGGVATAAGTAAGNAGSDSSFGSWTAKGGNGPPGSTAGGAGGGPRGGAGGTGNNAGAIGTSETPSFYGGSGGGGHGSSAFGGGSGGRLTGGAPGTATVNSGGGGGATPIGAGGAGGDANAAGTAASANTGAGGGGGGNGSNTVGTAGGSGKVVVYWLG